MTNESEDPDFAEIDLVIEEMVERIRFGESFSVEEYVSKYPDLEDDIRAVYPALRIMEEAHEVSEQEHARSSNVEQIGDYRIIRKIGHGGMGVVYEAIQESLGRRVALKVLPQSLSSNEKFIKRFRVEARAAASLHHTNIVPVFDVGRDGDTFYYAMQFIQGQTLEDVTEEVRAILNDPGETASSTLSKMLQTTASERNRHHSYYKAIAKVGVDVANALDYAHDRSILHRDVKPSNLILDRSGSVWLTDFGLAKSADEGLTETGDILGTLQFMSPERFKGQTDCRSDIYGLGMTIYELATLQKAFPTGDRLELIELVKRNEPPRPSAIRPWIPNNLEVIILKAIEKDPRRRYQTADALAEDLQRFIDDRPILAKRTTGLERAIRWCQRNKSATLAMISMASVIVVLSVAALMIGKQRDVAASSMREAQKQTEVAQENFALAFDSIENYLSVVGREGLLNEPGMEAVREKLLTSVDPILNRLVDLQTNGPEARTVRIKALYNRAVVLNSSGKVDESIVDFQNAIDEIKELPEWNEDADALSIKSKIETALSSALYAVGRRKEAQDAIQSGHQTARKLVEVSDNPTNRALLAASIRQLVPLAAGRGELDVAEKLAREAVEVLGDINEETEPETWIINELGLCKRLVGAVCAGVGKYDEAISHFESAIPEFERSLKLEPKSAQTRYYLANQYLSLAQMHNRVAAYDKGLEFNQRAIESLRQLVRDFPRANRYRSELASVYQSIGLAHWKKGDYQSALGNQKESLALRSRLFEDNPDNIEYNVKLARIVFNIALTEDRVGDIPLDEVVKRNRKAVEIGKRVCQLQSDNPRYWSDLSRYQSGLADKLMELGEWDEARQVLETSLQELAALPEKSQGNPEVIIGFLQTSASLGNLWLERLGDAKKGIGFFKAGVDRGLDALEKIPKNNTLKVQLRRCLQGLGWAQLGLGEYQNAENTFKECLSFATSKSMEFEYQLNGLTALAFSGQTDLAAKLFAEFTHDLEPEQKTELAFTRACFWAAVWSSSNNSDEQSVDLSAALDRCLKALGDIVNPESDFGVVLKNNPAFRKLADHPEIVTWINSISND